MVRLGLQLAAGFAAIAADSAAIAAGSAVAAEAIVASKMAAKIVFILYISLT